MYFDDCLGGVNNHNESTTVNQRRTYLTDFGFIFAEEKFNWNTVKVITIWNTMDPSEDKI